jgi:lipopolysaccharide transport system ATP-binding protein
MSDTAILVEDLSKMYRLGTVGSGTLVADVNKFVANILGKEDPTRPIDLNNRTSKAVSEYVWSLKDITFEIKQGDAVGVIGRNGAGKSTLLKILSRVTAPTKGSVKIRGRVSSLLEVGTGFHPELSGRDNIYMNGAILGMSRNEIKSKFEEIVDFSGVEKYIDTPVKRYSSGMYVRLAFAVAAHLEPDILIVDEVLAVGDAEFQKKCLGKMRDVNNKDGRTVLFVSHHLPSIQTLCTSALLLEHGLLTKTGAVSDVLNAYSFNDTSNLIMDLSQRKDRIGNGLVEIQKIQFYNQSNEEIIKPITGQVLIVKMKYKSTYNMMNDLLFRIQFFDLDGNLLFLCNNEHSHKLFSSEEGVCNVSCMIPKFPLFSGTYYINTLCYSKTLGVLDEIEHAIKLEVEDGDFFGTGKLPTIKKGIIVNHTWSHE